MAATSATISATITTAPDGSAAAVRFAARPARPSDEGAVAELLARCSPDALYRRFHGAVGSAVTHEIRRIANRTDGHRSWVVVAHGAVRGTATLAWGSDGVVEAAFLVEDAWARRGVGAALYEAVAREARREHVPEVTAWVQGDNESARRFLRAMAPDARITFAGYGELEVILPMSASVPAPAREQSQLRRIA